MSQLQKAFNMCSVFSTFFLVLHVLLLIRPWDKKAKWENVNALGKRFVECYSEHLRCPAVQPRVGGGRECAASPLAVFQALVDHYPSSRVSFTWVYRWFTELTCWLKNTGLRPTTAPRRWRSRRGFLLLEGVEGVKCTGYLDFDRSSSRLYLLMWIKENSKVFILNKI